MGFTVIYPGGTKDAEFQAYARLLRQSGVDLGNSPRVSEPGTERRWLYVWNTREEAQVFADELKKRTRQQEWRVYETNASASEGPLGPLWIQLVRHADGLTFALHPLSRALLKTAYPSSRTVVTNAFIDTKTWYDYRGTKGGLDELVWDLLPNLTGLGPEDIRELGYQVLDADTDETLVSAPPLSHAR
jgi:hypothetical protein